MTEKDVEIQSLRRELGLAKNEIERLRKERDKYLSLSNWQRDLIDLLKGALDETQS